MTVSRIKAVCVEVALVLSVVFLASFPVTAQTAAEPSLDDGREASFVPPPLASKTATGATAATKDSKDLTFPPPLVISKPESKPVSSAGASSVQPSAAPVELGQPVASESLGSVDPDTLGLLSTTTGGLGASMWEGTPRSLVERLLGDLNLPTASPTMNGLVRRMLLSTAAVPVGETHSKRRPTTLRL